MRQLLEILLLRSRTIRNYGDARGTSGYTGSSPSTSHRSAIRKGLDSYD